jgi:hypothetical protein
MKLLQAILALGSVATGTSIHEVDFKNFSYPFIQHRYVSLPDHLRWMPRVGAKLTSLRDGRHTFLCDGEPCGLLTLDHIDFDHVNGLPGNVALVLIGFHTGGTAQWQYLYVIALRSGKPRAVAWLEAGSRGYMGLRRLQVDRGDLVMIANDPGKRRGDCCSTGTLTYRYRWASGHFRQIGEPVSADDPPQ